MKSQFDIEIVVQNSLVHSGSDPSLENILPIIQSMDPWTLTSIFVMSSVLKSTSLALYSLYDQATVDEILNISRTGENYQIYCHG